MQYYKPVARKPRAELAERFASEDADEFLLTNGKFVKGGLQKLLYRRHSIDGSRKNLNRNQQRRSILKKDGETFANSLLNRARDSVSRARPRNSVQFLATTHGDSSLNQNTSDGSPDNTRALFRSFGNTFRLKNLAARSKLHKLPDRRKSILNEASRDGPDAPGPVAASPLSFPRAEFFRLKAVLGRAGSVLREDEELPGSERGADRAPQAQQPAKRVVREIDTGAGLRLVLDKISDKSSENSELSASLASKALGRLDSKKRSESFASAEAQVPPGIAPIQKLISDFAAYQKVPVPSHFSPLARELPPRHFATPTPGPSSTTKHKEKTGTFFNPRTVGELPNSSRRSPLKQSANFREMLGDAQAVSPAKAVRQQQVDSMDALKRELQKASRSSEAARLRFAPAYRRTEHGFTVVERDDLNYLKQVPMISPRLRGPIQSRGKLEASPRKREKKGLLVVRRSDADVPKPAFFRVLDPKRRLLADSTDLFKRDLEELRRSLGTQPLSNPLAAGRRPEFMQLQAAASVV